MIVAWIGLVVMAIAVILALPASSTVRRVEWPGETPLSLHDNRGRDPHLRHLARILSSESTAEARATIVAIAEARSPRAELTSFLASSADRDHDQFLHRVAAALDRIERL